MTPEETQKEIQTQRLQDKKTFENALRIQWEAHPYNTVIKEQLQKFREQNLMEAENIAINSPVDKDALIAKLSASITTRKLLESFFGVGK